MHVEDIERALAFFTGILGFETCFRAANYAYVHRETTGFRILEQTGSDAAPPGNRRFAYYIDVRPRRWALRRTQAEARHSAQG